MDENLKEYHQLAWKGCWHKIPLNELKSFHIEYETPTHSTILHAAAKDITLHLIPKEFHTLENYLKRDEKGRSVFEVSLLKGSVSDIPKELFNKQSAVMPCKAIDSRPLLSQVIDFIKSSDYAKEILSPELLMLKEYEDMYFIHSIARRGWLKFLPPRIFTKELVELKDSCGRNLLHYAAKYEGIRVIPQEFLTKENLSVQETSGRSPLHLAIDNGNVFFRDQFPDGILSIELLLLSDKLGETTYHKAVQNGNFSEIDPNLITEDALSKKDKKDFSSLDYLLDSYYTKDNIKDLRTGLKCLKEKTLFKIRDDFETKGDKIILKELNRETIKRNLGTMGVKEPLIEI